MARPPLTIELVDPTGGACPEQRRWILRDPALARLAGFDALPLPFTPEATPAEVIAHLRQLNPHREVRFERSQHFPLPSSPVSGASAIPHPS